MVFDLGKPHSSGDRQTSTRVTVANKHPSPAAVHGTPTYPRATMSPAHAKTVNVLIDSAPRQNGQSVQGVAVTGKELPRPARIFNERRAQRFRSVSGLLTWRTVPQPAQIGR